MDPIRVVANCFAITLFLFSAGIRAQSSELVALGCNPASQVLRIPKDADTYRTAPRERYVFMWKQPDGDISKLCIDELGTDETQSKTCVVGEDLSSGASEISARWLAGFQRVTVYRADASMKTETWGDEVHNYSCAPSKDPSKVLEFVSQEKQRQKSANIF